jgi:hypothetical protein
MIETDSTPKKVTCLTTYNDTKSKICTNFCSTCEIPKNLGLQSAIPGRFSQFVDPSSKIFGVCLTTAVIKEIKLENQCQDAMHKLNAHFNLNYDKKYFNM